MNKKQIKSKQLCKHSWGDVVTKDNTIGCHFCDARKKVSPDYSRSLGKAHRMDANYTYRDEY